MEGFGHENGWVSVSLVLSLGSSFFWAVNFVFWVMSRTDTMTTTSDLNRTGPVERDIEQVNWLVRDYCIQIELLNVYLLLLTIQYGFNWLFSV